MRVLHRRLPSLARWRVALKGKNGARQTHCGSDTLSESGCKGGWPAGRLNILLRFFYVSKWLARDRCVSQDGHIFQASGALAVATRGGPCNGRRVTDKSELGSLKTLRGCSCGDRRETVSSVTAEMNYSGSPFSPRTPNGRESRFDDWG